MTKRNIKKVKKVLNAWEKLAPQKTFAGMTLEEFKAQTQPLLDLQEKQDAMDEELTDSGRLLANLSRDGLSLAKFVVNSVKGDPQHGEDSPLYAAMGYVRQSERHSGLTRKTAQAETTAPQLLKAA